MQLVQRALGILLSTAGIAGCATPQNPPKPRVSPACLERPAALAGPVSKAESPDREAAEEAYRRGRALAGQEDHAAAIQAFADAIDADPTHAGAHLAMAKSHLAWDGDPEAIRRHLGLALVLSPDNAGAHVLLAQYLSGTGEAEGAAIHYRCALSLDPDLSDARIELAAQLVNSGRHADALAELEKVTGTGRKVGFRVRALMASALEAQGRFGPAGDHLEKAAEETGSAVLYRRAADLFARAGEDEKAASLRSRADEIDPPPERPEMRPLVKAKPPRKRKRRRKRRRRR